VKIVKVAAKGISKLVMGMFAISLSFGFCLIGEAAFDLVIDFVNSLIQKSKAFETVFFFRVCNVYFFDCVLFRQCTLGRIFWQQEV
jgi:hypothetical protein